MDVRFSIKTMTEGKYLSILSVAILIILVGLMMSSPLKVAADAGGWPTSTPTLTPLPPTATQIQETAAVLPTLPQIIFPPTNTPTQSTVGLLEGQAIPQVVLEEEPATNRNITALLCWPLGIILVVGTVIGLILLRNRILSSAP